MFIHGFLKTSSVRMRMLFQPDKMTGQTKLRFSDYIQRKEMQVFVSFSLEGIRHYLTVSSQVF